MVLVSLNAIGKAGTARSLIIVTSLPYQPSTMDEQRLEVYLLFSQAKVEEVQKAIAQSKVDIAHLTRKLARYEDFRANS